MDGIHDLGGKAGYGPVIKEKDEPVFHARCALRAVELLKMIYPDSAELTRDRGILL